MNTYFEKGLIKPISPVTIYSAEEIQNAFRYMQKGKHIGKIVIKMPENIKSISATPLRSKLSLRSDHIYLFIGGLGGLGRATSTWLVEHGAKHIAFMSRSAGLMPKSDPFIEDLEMMGCTVQLHEGSVNKLEDVERVVSTLGMPIAGIFQASMVLEVSAATHDQSE
jgi:hypothetical protein